MFLVETVEQIVDAGGDHQVLGGLHVCSNIVDGKPWGGEFNERTGDTILIVNDPRAKFGSPSLLWTGVMPT